MRNHVEQTWVVEAKCMQIVMKIFKLHCVISLASLGKIRDCTHPASLARACASHAPIADLQVILSRIISSMPSVLGRQMDQLTSQPADLSLRQTESFSVDSALRVGKWSVENIALGSLQSTQPRGRSCRVVANSNSRQVSECAVKEGSNCIDWSV